ncbi:MAG: cob(I)yrinic acid a,c-diamide adenosyltransferase [Clostridia bacterium]
MVHIYCGDGKGKTTACTGLAVRAIGSGKKVLFVQFFKNGESSEVKVLKSLENLTYMKANKKLGRFANMSEDDKKVAFSFFNELLINAIDSADNFDMIVFDEIISTYNLGFIDKKVILDFCKNTEKEVVLSGRNPADELAEIADYVSEIKKIKHPFDSGVTARLGIEF